MNYILIKDLPDLKKGAVFESSPDGVIYYHHTDDNDLKIYRKKEVENSEFFKEVHEA